MNRVLTTVPAHFDGTQVRLDVEVELKPDTRLLVTILDETKQSLAQMKRKQQLAAAAKALLPDYAIGSELTIFTALDSEDFYAQE